MRNPLRSLAIKTVDGLAMLLERRWRYGNGIPPAALGGDARLLDPRLIGELSQRVDELEADLDEARKLNQRLADVLDVITEVLVPAADRDDEQLQEALGKLDDVVDLGPPRHPDRPHQDGPVRSRGGR